MGTSSHVASHVFELPSLHVALARSADDFGKIGGV
jgi:hypothetical protein